MPSFSEDASMYPDPKNARENVRRVKTEAKMSRKSTREAKTEVETSCVWRQDEAKLSKM